MNELPQDPFMLMSVVNMKLRDQYGSLDEFCASTGVNREELSQRLLTIGFEYNPQTNKFW